MRWLVPTLLAFGLPALLAAQDLSQTEAVRAALAASPRLDAARAASAAGAAQAAQARLDQLGRLELTAQWNPGYRNPELTFPGAPPVVVPLGSLRRDQLEASFSQPLWTWGALSGRARAAALREQAGLQAETREAQQVAFAAAQAFLEARAAQEAVAVAAETLARAQAFLATASARVAEGSAARLDLLKAELAVSEAQAGLLLAGNRERGRREALVTVTQDARFRTAVLGASPDPGGELPGEAEALERARRQRPDLEGAARQAEAFRVGAAAERAAGRPSLSLRGDLSQGSDQLAGFRQPAERSAFLGLAVQWELFSGRRAQARQAELAARARGQAAQAQALEDQVGLEVREARWGIEDAGARVAVARRALAQAEEAARVGAAAYREGIRTAVEYQGDELALSEARYRHLSAHLDLGLAWAALRLALGE